MAAPARRMLQRGAARARALLAHHHHRHQQAITHTLSAVRCTVASPAPVHGLPHHQPWRWFGSTAGAACGDAARAATVMTDVSMSGSCSCGSVGWKVHGPSALNFVCHCSVCRASSGKDFVPAVGFKPTQVEWVNEAGMRKYTPQGSRNERRECSSCGSYIGEDATTLLGVVALPLESAQGTVPACYQPNQHIFYASRAVDVQDAAPKWETLPHHKIVHQEPAVTGSSTPAAGGVTGNVTTVHDAASGQLTKCVLPVSPTRAPDMKEYYFTEVDPLANHITDIPSDKIRERVQRKYDPSPSPQPLRTTQRRDVIVVGGGHNGLIAAAYLAKQGLDVLVLERRHVLGGAAVTEELMPGFKFSRGSYLAGLLRPQIIEDLELEKHGFKYLPRDPSSFTPSLVDGPLRGKHLMLWGDEAKTHASISQFSAKDADAFPLYEEFLGQVRSIVSPLLDGAPPDPREGKRRERGRTWSQIRDVVRMGYANREILVPFYELMTAPASHILDRWFESEILKTTLATDAVVGAMTSPTHAGSAYVLLHHVMGTAAGRDGVWAYVQGGMGALSGSVAGAARKWGAELVTNATVSTLLTAPVGSQRQAGDPTHRVTGVQLEDGSIVEADTVLSNATPYHTFLELLPGLAAASGNTAALEEADGPLPHDFVQHVRFTDYSCGSLKINCAVSALPNFACCPNAPGGKPGPQHRGTVHFENTMQEIEDAYREASMGMPATRPVVEMTIPSSLDKTVAPPGQHVVQLFVQFAPYDVDPKFGSWADPAFKEAFADRVFGIVDEFCPGFSSTVLYRDILSPLDLERVFGLHRGSISHGALSLHQLGYSRPAPGYSSHRTPVQGLYVCGAGSHPGGGVMGAPGRNCAMNVLSDLNVA